MKRSRDVLLSSVLAFVLVVAGADRIAAETLVSGDPDTVESVLERYVQACGGSALGTVRTETGKGTLVRYLAGNVPLTVVSQAPGKFFYHQLFAWGD